MRRKWHSPPLSLSALEAIWSLDWITSLAIVTFPLLLRCLVQLTGTGKGGKDGARNGPFISCRAKKRARVAFEGWPYLMVYRKELLIAAKAKTEGHSLVMRRWPCKWDLVFMAKCTSEDNRWRHELSVASFSFIIFHCSFVPLWDLSLRKAFNNSPGLRHNSSNQGNRPIRNRDNSRLHTRFASVRILSWEQVGPISFVGHFSLLLGTPPVTMPLTGKLWQF